MPPSTALSATLPHHGLKAELSSSATKDLLSKRGGTRAYTLKSRTRLGESRSCYIYGAITAVLSRLRAIDYATAIKAGPAALCYEATLPRQRLCEARPTKAKASA